MRHEASVRMNVEGELQPRARGRFARTVLSPQHTTLDASTAIAREDFPRHHQRRSDHVEGDGLPRVLFVGVGNPWRGGAGYLVRQRMLLDALERCAIIHCAMFDCDGPVPSSRRITHVSPVPMPRAPQPSGNGPLAWLRDVCSPWPRAMQGLECSATRRRIAELQPGRFDAVVAYRIDFAHYAGVLGHPRLVLDIDDAEHVRRRERLRAAPLDASHREGPRWYLALDLARLKRFERSAVGQARVSMVCHAGDASAFAPARPVVAPNAVAVPARCAPRRAHAPVVLLLANLEGERGSPNVDGALWLVRDIWPLVLALHPGAVLRIVGGISPWLRACLRQHRNVIVSGHVADLPEAFAAASLSIAPIRYGTGTRIKILESMAWGCPVVTTSKGCEGLAVEHDRQVLIGDDPASLASHCNRVLRDWRKQRWLARAAYECVAAQYDRGRAIDDLAHVFRDALQRLRQERCEQAAS